MKNFFDKYGYCPYSSSCEECNWYRACEYGNLNKLSKLWIKLKKVKRKKKG